MVADERELEVGLFVHGDTRAEFLSRARGLTSAMHPNAGMGRLEVFEGDGTSRWVECLCVEGLEGAERDGAGDDTWWRPVLSFLAPDPYARGQAVAASWSLQAGRASWFPIIPIRLGRSGIAARQAVFNPGDVEVFPVIRVTGPGTSVVLRHRGTGRTTTLAYAIPAEGLGATVTLDARDGTVVDGFGVNLFEYLTDEDPSMWSLSPGENLLEAEVAGAESSTSVSVWFEPLFESL